MRDITKGYSSWLIEGVRIKLGYSADDSSHDKEVVEYLRSGEKLSKSKHMSNNFKKRKREK